jgi:acyl-CoA thioesterase-2
VTERPTPEALRDGLVQDLRLEATDDPDRFVGQNVFQPFGRVFGGQVLGQSLMAAGRTVDADRPPHSLHAYFLRPGDPEVPIEFAVERLRDGRSFSARRTHAMQHGRPILSMIASFQAPVDGLEHADPMPSAPPPEDVPTTAEVLAGIDHRAAAYWSHERPMDIRNIDSPIFLRPAEDRSPDSRVWLRTPAALPDEPLLHAAVLAFASDYSLLEAVLRRHGLAWAHPGMKVASLDHAMWFHRPARADDWLLYTHHSPSASSARGLVQGSMFDGEGRLVATVAQEGMIRVREGSPG